MQSLLITGGTVIDGTLAPRRVADVRVRDGRIVLPDGLSYVYLEGGKGTTSQNSIVQHFGLGRSDEPVTVTVRFGQRSAVTLVGPRPRW